MTTWLVTGGAGFIGGNFVLEAVARGVKVVNLDALTYAGNRDTLASLDGDPNHVFVHGDIGDRDLVAKLLAEHRPDAVLTFQPRRAISKTRRPLPHAGSSICRDLSPRPKRSCSASRNAPSFGVSASKMMS